jgi:hypothetical protein
VANRLPLKCFWADERGHSIVDDRSLLVVMVIVALGVAANELGGPLLHLLHWMGL